MGAGCLVVVSLHTGYEVALNVHWFVYWLMVSVIASGAHGAFAYTRYPERMARNRFGVTMDELMHRISDIDTECRAAAIGLDDALNQAVHKVSRDTRVGAHGGGR